MRSSGRSEKPPATPSVVARSGNRPDGWTKTAVLVLGDGCSARPRKRRGIGGTVGFWVTAAARLRGCTPRQRRVEVLAIGEKEGNRLIVGGEEVEL